MGKTNGADGREEAVEEKTAKQTSEPTGQVGQERQETQKTPIWISKQTRTALLLGGLAVLVLLI